MPLYTCRCVRCAHEQDYFATVENRNITPECELCKSPTEKIISTYSVVDDQEYVDHNLTDHPVRVKSKKHRKELMSQYGVYEKFGKGWR